MLPSQVHYGFSFAAIVVVQFHTHDIGAELGNGARDVGVRTTRRHFELHAEPIEVAVCSCRIGAQVEYTGATAALALVVGNESRGGCAQDEAGKRNCSRDAFANGLRRCGADPHSATGSGRDAWLHALREALGGVHGRFGCAMAAEVVTFKIPTLSLGFQQVRYNTNIRTPAAWAAGTAQRQGSGPLVVLPIGNILSRLRNWLSHCDPNHGRLMFGYEPFA